MTTTLEFKEPRFNKTLPATASIGFREGWLVVTYRKGHYSTERTEYYPAHLVLRVIEDETGKEHEPF